MLLDAAASLGAATCYSWRRETACERHVIAVALIERFIAKSDARVVSAARERTDEGRLALVPFHHGHHATRAGTKFPDSRVSVRWWHYEIS